MNKIAINNGLFLGAILVATSMLFYFINVEAFLMYKSYILFLVVIILYYKTSTDVRKSQDGFITFGEAFKSIMIASLIGFGICTAFEYILFNLIDPTLADQMKDFALEKMEEASAMLSDDMLEEVTEKLEEEDFSLTLGKSFLNYSIRLLFPAAVVGAIVSAIVKKNQPDFA